MSIDLISNKLMQKKTARLHSEAYQYPFEALSLEVLYPLVQKEIALLRIHANQILVSLHLAGKLAPIFVKIFTQKTLCYYCKIVDAGNQEKSLTQINNYLN